MQHKDMNEVKAEFPTKSHADVIEFYYNWKFHEPDYSRWQVTKRQIDIILVSQANRCTLLSFHMFSLLSPARAVLPTFGFIYFTRLEKTSYESIATQTKAVGQRGVNGWRQPYGGSSVGDDQPTIIAFA